MTTYKLKTRFQAMLRFATAGLAAMGVTANQVTVGASAISIGIGAVVALNATNPLYFWLIPVWLFIRMALNAIDGLLARDFGQKSPLGAYLNELCDVVSDAALYLPFALVAPFQPAWVAVVIFLAAMAEFAGALGPMVGASRRYEGPMGKSDRALVFGGLGLAIALLAPLPAWTAWIMPAIALLLCATIVNRVRGALHQLRRIPRLRR